jgi:hypothetical protein
VINDLGFNHGMQHKKADLHRPPNADVYPTLPEWRMSSASVR